MGETEKHLPVGSDDLVGHPWFSKGKIDARKAGTWTANLILTAGGAASTAFECAAMIARDIESNPEKFGPPNSNADLPDKAAQDSASPADSPAVSG